MDIQYLLRQGRFVAAWGINDLIIIMQSVQVNQEELGVEAVRVTAKLLSLIHISEPTRPY